MKSYQLSSMERERENSIQDYLVTALKFWRRRCDDSARVRVDWWIRQIQRLATEEDSE